MGFSIGVTTLLNVLLIGTSAADGSLRRRKATVYPIESIDAVELPDESLNRSNGFFEDDPAMWRDLLEMSYSMSFSMSMSMGISNNCHCSDDCLPLDAMPFDVEESVDIGSTGATGETNQCGPNCFRLKGTGPDMCSNDSVDAEGPDAVHFAYKKVSGPFILASKVCGALSVDVVENTTPRTGLMVRESTDPLVQNFYLSHSPEAEANWSARRETNGSTSCNFDGSVDVPCVYLILERFAPGDGDFEFIGYYSYEVNFLDDVKTCNQRQVAFEVAFNGFSFPDEVLVGMAVLSGNGEEVYESQFNEIYFTDENMFRDMPFTSRYTI